MQFPIEKNHKTDRKERDEPEQGRELEAMASLEIAELDNKLLGGSAFIVGKVFSTIGIDSMSSRMYQSNFISVSMA